MTNRKALGDQKTFFGVGEGANKNLHEYFFTCPNITDLISKFHVKIIKKQLATLLQIW